MLQTDSLSAAAITSENPSLKDGSTHGWSSWTGSTISGVSCNSVTHMKGLRISYLASSLTEVVVHIVGKRL